MQLSIIVPIKRAAQAKECNKADSVRVGAKVQISTLKSGNQYNHFCLLSLNLKWS